MGSSMCLKYKDMFLISAWKVDKEWPGFTKGSEPTWIDPKEVHPYLRKSNTCKNTSLRTLNILMCIDCWLGRYATCDNDVRIFLSFRTFTSWLTALKNTKLSLPM